MNGQVNCDIMTNMKELWREINRENINKHFYGYAQNVKSKASFIKDMLGTKKAPRLPKGLADSFNVIYQADVKIYQPVANVAFFRDKYKDIYIFFDITNQHNPKTLLVITGYEMETLPYDLDFNKFLKEIKRNKWVI